MKRVTITLPDDLEADLEEFLSNQDPAPSLTSLVQTALRSFLRKKDLEQALECRSLRSARGNLRITAAAQGSGESDISIDHDGHFAAR